MLLLVFFASWNYLSVPFGPDSETVEPRSLGEKALVSSINKDPINKVLLVYRTYCKSQGALPEHLEYLKVENVLGMMLAPNFLYWQQGKFLARSVTPSRSGRKATLCRRVILASFNSPWTPPARPSMWITTRAGNESVGVVASQDGRPDR